MHCNFFLLPSHPVFMHSFWRQHFISYIICWCGMSAEKWCSLYMLLISCIFSIFLWQRGGSRNLTICCSRLIESCGFPHRAAKTGAGYFDLIDWIPWFSPYWVGRTWLGSLNSLIESHGFPLTELVGLGWVLWTRALYGLMSVRPDVTLYSLYLTVK